MRRVYRAWDAAIGAGHIDALVQLYALDAEVESPLIYEFTAGKTGKLRGREAFRPLYEKVAYSHSDVIRPIHHDEYLADGHRIVWEYPRVMPSEERSEFVESWDFNDRYEIRHHL
jgi:steroid Delta-isomerase